MIVRAEQASVELEISKIALSSIDHLETFVHRPRSIVPYFSASIRTCQSTTFCGA
jgi:hypothetical protein